MTKLLCANKLEKNYNSVTMRAEGPLSNEVTVMQNVESTPKDRTHPARGPYSLYRVNKDVGIGDL